MPKIIDCTLRDGGYYNSWDFDPATVQRYLNALAISGVDIVEIGFRMQPKNTFYGAFAYSTDDFLRTLNIPDSLELAVMINGSDFLDPGESEAAAIDSFFKESSSSPVQIVRVALRSVEVTRSRQIVQRLHELGYRLVVNLMQVDAMSDADLKTAASEIWSWGCVEVLYFADSLGNLEPTSVHRIVKTLSQAWSGALGFHSHDNKGQALANCLAATDAGVSWLDGTILGMGRGAGNVRTESLLIELNSRAFGNYNTQPLYALVLEDFGRLHKKYNWGANLFYHLAAVNGIHPTYVQELLGQDRYSLDEILTAMKYLGRIESRSYNRSTLGDAVRNRETGGGVGAWKATGWARDREVLILGSGPSTARHLTAISHFVARSKPLVLCLNVNRSVPPELVTAYVACHESRIAIESNQYASLKRPVILPMTRVPRGVLPVLDGVEVLDYGLEISAAQIEANESGCKLPSTMSAAYAIAVSISAGARRILMAGFDGYAAGDPQQDDMIRILEQFQHMNNHIPVIAVTPTTYPIPQRSIYEPGL